MLLSGESPAPSHKSRQNSSSSSHQSHSLFSHRPSTSSASKDTANGGGNLAVVRGKTGTANKNTLPSIRGYTSFNDSQRPITPLYDPFHPRQQSANDTWQSTSRFPPQIRMDYEQPDSYVAALSMAPLVTRPPQGGEAVYIKGGIPIGDQQPHGSFLAPLQTPVSAPVSHAPESFGHAPRPFIRQRSLSFNSYLASRHAEMAEPSTGISIRGEVDARRSKSKARSRSSRRENSNASSDTPKLGSRFVRYDGCLTLPPFHRRRSSSTGAADVFRPPPRRDSLQRDTSGNVIRPSRSRTRQRSDEVSPSVDRRTGERKQFNKLVSARLPGSNQGRTTTHHMRLPSQPLGLTWVCGCRSAARSPSFYDNFEYSRYPGGRRKRSFSRSNTPTPHNTSTLPTPFTYESEPESIPQRLVRTASMRQNFPLVSDNSPERTLRGKSQSIVDLRHAAADRHGGLLISAPMFDSPRPNDLLRLPRAAPSPDMDIKGPTDTNAQMSIDDTADSRQRKEALFAALPPAMRRSPTPSMPSGPTMYPTGRLIATTVEPTYDYDDPKSPPMEDLAQFAASRVIIGESQLANSTGPERYPVVYGRAFSTEENVQSVEGEIMDVSVETRQATPGDHSLSSVGQLSVLSENAGNDNSASGSGSAADSSHVLDLREENFQNLVREVIEYQYILTEKLSVNL